VRVLSLSPNTAKNKIKYPLSWLITVEEKQKSLTKYIVNRLRFRSVTRVLILHRRKRNRDFMTMGSTDGSRYVTSRISNVLRYLLRCT
jgi:hypothetical protein